VKQGKSFWLALLAGMAVCCGVKLLILSGGLSFLAGILTGRDWWLIFGGVVLLLGAGWWLMRRCRSVRCEESGDEAKEKGTSCSSQRS
jgi:ABC-type nickel/cobalt efflux system permease component RcnA